MEREKVRDIKSNIERRGRREKKRGNEKKVKKRGRKEKE